MGEGDEAVRPSRVVVDWLVAFGYEAGNAVAEPLNSAKVKVDCLKCRHFYVTWDEKAPRGCRAMGFKSKEMPILVVRQASGGECLAFQRKGGKQA